jgi:hypothetical protein
MIYEFANKQLEKTTIEQIHFRVVYIRMSNDNFVRLYSTMKEQTERLSVQKPKQYIYIYINLRVEIFDEFECDIKAVVATRSKQLQFFPRRIMQLNYTTCVRSIDETFCVVISASRKRAVVIDVVAVPAMRTSCESKRRRQHKNTHTIKPPTVAKFPVRQDTRSAAAPDGAQRQRRNGRILVEHSLCDDDFQFVRRRNKAALLLSSLLVAYTIDAGEGYIERQQFLCMIRTTYCVSNCCKRKSGLRNKQKPANKQHCT